MKWLLAALLVLPLLLGCAATADDPLGTGFLKEQPYRKTKQKVDLSSIGSAHEMAVVKSAINPVMRFMVDMSFAELPPAMPEKLLTEHGRRVLRRPPLQDELNRYVVARMSNWKVCGDKMISLHASFYDLLRKNFWSEKFLFVESGDGWRFDDHKEIQCQSQG